MVKDSFGSFLSNTAAQVVGGAILLGVGAVVSGGFKNDSSAISTLIWLALIAAASVLFVIFKYYFDVLGSGKKVKGTREREAYDHLRATLAEGGFSAHLYVQRLTWFLGKVDTFFGDADKSIRTLFPHAFGLRTPAPLWTAPSFD